MKKLLTLLSVFLAVQLLAQDQTTFSLAEAEDFGANNTEKIKNSILDYEAARKRVWETTSIGLPQVKAKGEFQQLIDIPTQVVDASLFNPLAPPGEVMEFQMGQEFSTSLTFTVSQLIFDGSYIVGLKFSKFWMKMNENGMTRSQHEVRALVREAYYNVLVAQKNVSLMDSILVSTADMEKQTRIFYENGLILKEDADQLTYSLNRIKASKGNAVRQLEIAKNLLKLQMGYDLDKDIELTENLDDVLASIIADSPVSKEYAPDMNANYQMLTEQKTLDEFNVMNEKAKYYPSVGAFFTHSQNAFRNEFNFFDDLPWYPTTVWGIALNIPITTSGGQMMRVQQAEIKVEKDNNTISELERALEFQELQLKAQFQNAYDMMMIEKENVELAEFIYTQGLKKKANGAISSLELTQLQNQLLQAEGSYIGAIMDLLSVKIQLDKLFNKQD